jgi:hypothetical protein
MWSLSVVPEEVVEQSIVEAEQVVLQEVAVVVDELLLDGALKRSTWAFILSVRG